VPVAVVVRKDAELGEADVLAAFHGRIARYKHPHAVIFVAALPRNAMGKVVGEEIARLAVSS
jgi:fatty-acyl-CoA synthase